LDENFRCVTVTKPGCQTDESILHVMGHRGCQIDSNGIVPLYFFFRLRPDPLPLSLEAMTNFWSPNIVPNIVDQDKVKL
jgi:hypothetical protein